MAKASAAARFRKFVRVEGDCHLEAVTPGENIRRGILPAMIREQKAAISHCPKGHAYDSENTYRFRGKRHCKLCVADASLAYAARNREKRKLYSREYRRRKVNPQPLSDLR